MAGESARRQDGERASDGTALPDSSTPRLLDSISAAARQRHEETVALLQELVRVPSVNPYFTGTHGPSREGDVQDILADRLVRLGAQLDRWEPDAGDLAGYTGGPGYYPNRDFGGRPNLVATLTGSGGGRSLLLLGHVDVVSAGAGWTVNPFGADRRDGVVYGRGTADMKAGLTAAVAALEVLRAAGVGLRGDVIFASVVDEEAGGMGTLALVDRGYRADGAIIPEPTDLHVAPLCRGIVWGRLTIPGRAGHIEMPQPHWREGGAVDAIALGRAVLDAVDRLNARWAASPSKRHPLLPLPCQVKVSMLDAGEYPTAYASGMRITFDAQYLPAERDERGLGGHVKTELEHFFADVAGQDEWLQEHPPRIEWLIDADCAETPGDHPLTQTLHAAARLAGAESRVEGMSSHTDMGLLVNAGIPTVNFGPGVPSIAHQPDEHVTERDLQQATLALALAMAEWCGWEESHERAIPITL
ncbi:MAG TPA: ArgE/DapE family deacylase [Thermomicrobiales bacterium]|nr:ArgE/DapE family deacylase [Thermomicrobiales bacterium]